MTTTVDLRPETIDLTGYAGDTLRFRVTVADPTAVADGVWLAQVRATHDGTVAATFDITEIEPGSMSLTLDAADTAALQGGFAGYWDVEVTTGTTVRTLVKGKLSLSSDVTRAP